VRIHPECYPCFLRQTYNTLKLLTQDEEVQEKLLKEIMGKLAQYKGEDPPPKVSLIVYGTIAQRLGVTDPYREKKLECNRMALELYPRLKEMVRRAPDPLFMAVKVAIVGNIIDFGVGRTFKLETGEALEKLDLVVSHYARFRQDLERARRILYIGDNAGEVVFDRVLIEEMGEKEVIFAVRSVPIINDATLEDAKEAGIDQAARVIESGSWVPGTLLGESTPEFKDLFFNADMVISKGQGNFETLDDAPRAIYFLLRAKCDVVAQLLGVEVGSTLLIKGGLTLAR
jgi:uncharacterized protein with ATP-grasp and redox domains